MDKTEKPKPSFSKAEKLKTLDHFIMHRKKTSKAIKKEGKTPPKRYELDTMILMAIATDYRSSSTTGK